MLRLLLLTVFMLTTWFKCGAQTFGGSSPNVKWKQINTNQFRIIFPEGLDSTANKVAADIHFIAKPTVKTLGSITKKIPVVLRNKGLVSNGYVGLGPFRSEFYLTAPQNAFQLGSTPWPDLLASHEYRHVQQYNNFDVGLSHVMRVIFGQEGQVLANAASVPDWFFEGDAVYNETNITKQGRGSLPYFYNGFRALWRDKKNYSWMKLRNGSYRDFVPDKYILGFMLTAYGRERYGLDFWKDVTHDAASFKSLIYPFQSAIKKHSGVDYNTFRDSAFKFFKNQFHDSISHAAHPDFYQNEECPVFDTSGNLIFLKGSIRQIPRFVEIKNGKEIKIRTADYMVDPYFSYKNGMIVYASRSYDARWISKAFNEIQLLDVASGRQKTVTHKTRYFSPDINEAGDRIVAVNLEIDGSASLDVVDVTSGNVIKSFFHKNVVNFSYPKFYGRSVISCVSNADGQMSLIQFDLASGNAEFLVPFSYNVIGFPMLKNDTLYYSTSQKTNDELFAYTFSDKKIWNVISREPFIGKYHVAIKNDSLVWSSFSSQGLRLKSSGINGVSFEEMTAKTMSVVTSSFGLFSTNNINSNLIYRFEDTTFTSGKYPRLRRPFNFHSLEPTASDPEYSLTIVGENILNTVQSQLTFTYNRADRSKSAGINILYGGLFPVLTLGYDYAFDRRLLSNGQFVYYNASEPYGGFYIPLNFSRRRSIRSLSFGSNFKYHSSIFQKPFQGKFSNRDYSYISNFVSLSNQSQAASAQVFPRFAQSVYLNYKFPFGSLSGYQSLISAKLFLPGIGKTHSLNFSGAWSLKDTLGQINFSVNFPFARGYEAVNLHKVYGWQVNYQFPLAYPEAGFGNIAYLLRLRSNFFFDETIVNDFQKTGKSWKATFKSAGTELFFDTKWWNQVAVSFGVRYSYLLDKDIFGGSGNSRWEVIMPVNLFNK